MRKIARRISLARYLPQTSQLEDILDTAKGGSTGSFVLLDGQSVNVIRGDFKNPSHGLRPLRGWVSSTFVKIGPETVFFGQRVPFYVQFSTKAVGLGSGGSGEVPPFGFFLPTFWKNPFC